MKAISAKDRFEALSRIEGYVADWCFLLHLRASGNEREECEFTEVMCRKWKIPAPFAPFDRRSSFLCHEAPIEVIDKILPHHSPLQDNRVDQAIEKVAARKEGREPDTGILLPSEVQGRHLYVKVDLSKPDSLLLEEFSHLLKSFNFPGRPERQPGGGRPRKSSILFDKWAIYDECKGKDITPYAYAQEEAPGIDYRGAYIDHLDNCRKQAAAAFLEASEIVAEIIDEATLILPISAPSLP